MAEQQQSPNEQSTLLDKQKNQNNGNQPTGQQNVANQGADKQPVSQNADQQPERKSKYVNLTDPIHVTCPKCNKMVNSDVSFKTGTGTWLCVVTWCVVGLCAGLVPFFVNGCKDVYHHCSTENCKHLLKVDRYDPCNPDPVPETATKPEANNQSKQQVVTNPSNTSGQPSQQQGLQGTTGSSETQQKVQKV